MPTTFTALLLFALVVLPGAAYSVARGRRIPAQDRSAFRETATAIAAGLAGTITATGISWAIASAWNSTALDIGGLIAHPQNYLSEHYIRAGIWVVSILATATVVCAGAAALANRYMPVHPSSTSAWGMLFDRLVEDRRAYVGCSLDDGTWVEGPVGLFSKTELDSPDRDLTLFAPILTGKPGEHEPEPSPVGAVCIPARNIRALYVTYLDPNDPAFDVTSPETDHASPAPAAEDAQNPSEEPERPDADLA